MKTVNPIKTLSFAAVLAISVSTSPKGQLSEGNESAELPTAEELSAMGASKGVLLTHQSCEPLRTPEGGPKGNTPKGDVKQGTA